MRFFNFAKTFLFVSMILFPIRCFSFDANSSECVVYKKTDQDLNSVYKEILAKYNSDKIFLDKLKASQNAWIKFRDSHLNAMYPESDKLLNYGASYSQCSCIVLNELTMQRLVQLKKWVDGLPEGDVCTGSIKFSN